MTGKQQAFVDYIEDSSNKKTFGNGLESARAAGYGGNDRTLTVIAGQNLTKLDIKQAIADKRAERQQKADRTIGSLDKMYQAAYDLAKVCKIPAAMNQAVTGIARLYGMDKDAGGGKDAPEPIQPEKEELLRTLAKAVTEAELAKPRLAKDIA